MAGLTEAEKTGGFESQDWDWLSNMNDIRKRDVLKYELMFEYVASMQRSRLMTVYENWKTVLLVHESSNQVLFRNEMNRIVEHELQV